jgi:t-SNARE complex subunit (syntaxin)
MRAYQILMCHRVVAKLQAAENDLKQLMADVARAVEKAQEAVARITSKVAAATTETESMR